MQRGALEIMPGPAEAARLCAARTAAALREALETRERVAVALSGGSTPKLLFAAWLQENLDWARIDLFQVDERGVPPGDPQNNADMIVSHLVEPASIPPGKFHRIESQRSPSEAALRYAELLRSRLGDQPRFDLILCGAGADAHTASLFPGDPLIEDRTGLVSSTWVSKLNQWRITLLPRVLLDAAHLIGLVAGADKAQAMARILDADSPLHLAPARVLRETLNHLSWFLDTAAAADLPPEIRA